MAKRAPIPKSTRFEVFKRDKFTCQYCGATAPNVILEVDHIKPVSKGGSNDLLNLVTACRDCNRGKTNRDLSDDSVVMIQKRNLDDMQERREQLAMMLEWKESLEDEMDVEIAAINKLYKKNTDWHMGENCERDMRKLIRRFGFDEVYTAVEISVDRYYTGTERSWLFAFDKVGGICYNRKKAREQDAK